MPRVPPVTRAVIPWRDHLLSFMTHFVSAIVNELPGKGKAEAKIVFCDMDDEWGFEKPKWFSVIWICGPKFS